jgi:hypothetical protein
MKRAFILTLDALFATSLLAVFLLMFPFEFNTPKQNYWLPELGNNFMTAMDKSGVFYNIYNQTNSTAQTALTGNLSTLPPNVAASITVNIYYGANDVFTLQRTINASKGVLDLNQATYVKRVFTDTYGSHFGIAELVLSYG